MKIIITSLLVISTTVCSGCLSKMAHNSFNEARHREAIRIDANEQQVLVGVDLFSLDYLKENWAIAIPAAIADAAIIYTAIDYLDDLSSDNGNNGGNNMNIDVSGDNSSVTITTTTADNREQNADADF